MNRSAIKTFIAVIAACVLLLLVCTGGTATGASEWDQMVAALESGQTEYVLQHDMIAEHADTIVISGSVTIDLNGYEIRTATDSDAPLFAVTGTLHVKSSKDSGTVRLEDGSALFDLNGGTLTLDRAYLSGMGTDRIVRASNGHLTAKGSRFSGLANGSVNGGGICLTDGSAADITSTTLCRLQGQYGGAIYADESSSLTLDAQSVIENCHALIEGGAIYQNVGHGTVPSYPCTVRDCTSPNGEGIFIERELTPWEMLKAAVNRGETYVLEEDIYGEESDSADFIMGVSDAAGINLNGHTLTIHNNSPTPVVDVAPNATFTLQDTGDGRLVLEKCAAFVYNNGTAILENTALEATGSVLTFLTNNKNAALKNTSFAGGGLTEHGIITANGTVTLDHTAISKCGTSASAQGGGILIHSGTVKLGTGSTIQDCTAKSGGGIYNEYGQFIMDNAVISGCTVPISSGDGGGIRNCASAEINSGTVTNCSGYNGGGIYSDGTTIVRGSAVVGDCNATYGAGIYVKSGTSTFTGSAELTGCSATWGGGIYVESGTSAVADKTRISSCDSIRGGGIYNEQGTVSLTDNAVILDSYGSYGNGIYNSGTCVMDGASLITKCNSSGGGIYNTGRFTMKGGRVTECGISGSGSGGGVCNSTQDAVFIMQNSAEISDCIAYLGGGINNDQGTVTMEGGTITNCTGTLVGGGIYTLGEGSRCEIQRAALISNCSSYSGGGLEIKKTVTVISGNISGCESSNGGGVFISDGSLTLSGTVSDCTAKSEGGGIYNGSDTAALTGSIIGCSAKTGGGVYNKKTCNLNSGANIQSCTASAEGGGITNAKGAVLNMTKNSIKLCTAATKGGALYNQGRATGSGCSIQSCTAANGGGIHNYNGNCTLNGDTVIRDCTASASGGGVFNSTSTAGGTVLTIDGASVLNCHAEQDGGGIVNDWAITDILRGTVSGCSAKTGGGLYNVKQTTGMRLAVTSASCTISGNTPTDTSGVITYV